MWWVLILKVCWFYQFFCFVLFCIVWFLINCNDSNYFQNDCTQISNLTQELKRNQINMNLTSPIYKMCPNIVGSDL